MKTLDYAGMIKRTMLDYRGVSHASIFISIPRSYRSAAIRKAKELGYIEIATYNHLGQPLYRIGEKALFRKGT